MVKKRKSWADKLNKHDKPASVTVLKKPFAGFPPGASLLISTPLEVKTYIDSIPKGETRTVRELRETLAGGYEADGACPLTTGIFCRIVAEEALEAYAAGLPLEAVTPFWRIVQPDSRLAGKISCGPGFINERRAEEMAG